MKTMYVGPTIPSVATRNTVYEEMPEPLKKAAKAFPYLAGLCVPISELRKALDGIRKRDGPIYRLYPKALADSAEIQKGAHEYCLTSTA